MRYRQPIALWIAVVFVEMNPATAALTFLPV